jgi:hypothetical protein
MRTVAAVWKTTPERAEVVPAAATPTEPLNEAKMHWVQWCNPDVQTAQDLMLDDPGSPQSHAPPQAHLVPDACYALADLGDLENLGAPGVIDFPSEADSAVALPLAAPVPDGPASLHRIGVDELKQKIFELYGRPVGETEGRAGIYPKYAIQGSTLTPVTSAKGHRPYHDGNLSIGTFCAAILPPLLQLCAVGSFANGLTFVDIGGGVGHLAACVALTTCFTKIVSIEANPELVQAGRAAFARASGHVAECLRRVELILGDVEFSSLEGARVAWWANTAFDPAKIEAVMARLIQLSSLVLVFTYEALPDHVRFVLSQVTPAYSDWSPQPRQIRVYTVSPLSVRTGLSLEPPPPVMDAKGNGLRTKPFCKTSNELCSRKEGVHCHHPTELVPLEQPGAGAAFGSELLHCGLFGDVGMCPSNDQEVDVFTLQAFCGPAGRTSRRAGPPDRWGFVPQHKHVARPKLVRCSLDSAVAAQGAHTLREGWHRDLRPYTARITHFHGEPVTPENTRVFTRAQMLLLQPTLLREVEEVTSHAVGQRLTAVEVWCLKKNAANTGFSVWHKDGLAVEANVSVTGVYLLGALPRVGSAPVQPPAPASAPTMPAPAAAPTSPAPAAVQLLESTFAQLTLQARAPCLSPAALPARPQRLQAACCEPTCGADMLSSRTAATLGSRTSRRATCGQLYERVT